MSILLINLIGLKSGFKPLNFSTTRICVFEYEKSQRISLSV